MWREDGECGAKVESVCGMKVVWCEGRECGVKTESVVRR